LEEVYYRKDISPLKGVKVSAHEEDGRLVVDNIESASLNEIALSHISFDIETYNPKGVPRPEKDPVIMISYTMAVIARFLQQKRLRKTSCLSLRMKRRLSKAFQI